jgi:hypothetical protein
MVSPVSRAARSKRRRRFGGCGGKARYGSFAEAKAEQPAQHPYPCTSCGCWHLTSAPPVPGEIGNA